MRAAPYVRWLGFPGAFGLLCWYGFLRGGSGRPQRRGYRPRGLPVGGVQGSSRVAAAFAFLRRTQLPVSTERMNSAFEKPHLWMYLQALGLDPSWVAAVGGKMLPQAHLGE